MITLLSSRIDAVAYQSPGSTYSQGSGPIFLDNVGCNGGESRLVDCFFDNHTTDCSHVEDAGVKCQRKYNKFMSSHICKVDIISTS